MIEIVAAIGLGEKTGEDIEAKVRLVSPYLSWVQFDIADTTLVPTQTIVDAHVYKSIISQFPNMGFEAHLMVHDPLLYVSQYIDAGFKRFIFHIESAKFSLEAYKNNQIEVGVALDGQTPLSAIVPYIQKVDFVQIMTIHAGASGQKLLPDAIAKIRDLHAKFPDIPIEVDGGIHMDTIGAVKDAGATRFAVTSELFQNPSEISTTIEKLKNC